jgi:2-polyprenyl-3-methyl-5-hydroxy-6-metoxy-1,4-benzoquinol methylase
MNNCKICNSATKEVFQATVLFKYAVHYYQCTHCQFIQTEQPHWLEESYVEAITDLDLGYVTRNIFFAEVTGKLIRGSYHRKASFLDYGGGYGMFVRLMRDRGFDFYREDKYCDNLFSAHFDIEDEGVATGKKFDLLTAFEVFEHLEDPLSEIETMFRYSDSILFSTELQPDIDFKSAEDWWYVSPEIGQHIALFSQQALKEIAKKYNCQVYSARNSLHLLTKKKFRINPLTYPVYSTLILDKVLKRNFLNPKSLLKQDYEKVKQVLIDSKGDKKEA